MSYHYGHPPAKPSSITAVQVIAWVKVGLLGLAVCLVGIGTSMVGGSAGASSLPSGAMALLAVLVLVLVVLAVLYVVIAVNIVKGHNWARVMAIVVEVINLASVPFLLFGSDVVNPAPSVVGLVLSVLVIVFAAQESSREYCRVMSG